MPSRIGRTVFQYRAAVAVLLACAACAGSLEDPARFDTIPRGREDEKNAEPGGGANGTAAECGDVPATVFAAKCATAGCHSAADEAQGLDLESPEVAARLVGVRATGGEGYLIAPADPATSVIYTKLKSPPPYGTRMPFGQPLDDATVACVLDWITAQAETDGGQR